MHTVNDFCIVRALREFCTTTKIIKAVIPDKRGAIRNPGIKELVFRPPTSRGQAPRGRRLDTGFCRYDNSLVISPIAAQSLSTV